MQLGVFTPVFGSLSLPDMLAAVRGLRHVTALELGTGAWPGRAHIDPDRLLACPNDAKAYRQRFADAGLTISALSCHGNPLHPDPARARADDDTYRTTVRLAEQLEVPVVVTFSGCPGDHAGAKHPNWVTTAWPPEYQDVLEWQWQECAIPYWTEATAFAADHGVKVALEAHPGFLVYNVETAAPAARRRRPAARRQRRPESLVLAGHGPGGGDPRARRRHLPRPRQGRGARSRPTSPSTACSTPRATATWRSARGCSASVGWGHGEQEWKRIVSALRLAGYDAVLSIEHEDALASVDEGLRSAVDLLHRVLLTEPPAEAWWT